MEENNSTETVTETVAETPKKKRVVNRRTREHIRLSRGDAARLIKRLHKAVMEDDGSSDFAVLSALVQRLWPVTEGITSANVMQEVSVSY
jgi:hypothetical protein